MNEEIMLINQKLEALIDTYISQATPIAELSLQVNDREAYFFANREAFLRIASACLSLASENLDADGAHIHLDINNILFKVNLPLTLELRNDWDV